MQLAWTLSMNEVPRAGAKEDELALIAASVAGDPEAFEDLVRLHQRRVFQLAGRFFRRQEDVEDAAQQTFLAAWRGLRSYKSRAPFENWLTRVCLNCCYALLVSGPRKVEPIEGHDPPAVSADPDAAIDVDRLLGQLAPSDRFLLLLLYGEGWSVGEIAERLGWTSANVKVRAFRARRRLRRVLEGP